MSFENISNLKHIRRTFGGNGEIIVVDTGAVLTPECLAMLQALHSRSTGGFDAHMIKLQKQGPENFMRTYYTGYGHKSIGDCGVVTVFVEGVSMLCAKAIQHSPLYSGQEASTRYISFEKQLFSNPVGTKLGETIQENSRSAYLRSVDLLKGVLKTKHPIGADEDPKIYENAINARAFDIARSLLPAGATTNLACTMNIRQFGDHLNLLRYHPLKEVRQVAALTEDALAEMYPSSFAKKRYPETEDYNAYWMSNRYYYTDDPNTFPNFRMTRDTVDLTGLLTWSECLKRLPPKTELPKVMDSLGTVQFKLILDYASFRDLQRHRSVSQEMPLLSSDFGFNQWYLDGLEGVIDIKTFLKEQERLIRELNTSPKIAQYYMPMGYNCPCVLTGGLPALVYIANLRTTRFVHPTLVRQMRKMAYELILRFGKFGLTLHLDPEPDRFDIKRGTQTIFEKEGA